MLCRRQTLACDAARSAPRFGLVPIGGHIIWLHAVLALGLAWVGVVAADPVARGVAASAAKH
jgi:hypothetical protein